MVLRGGRRQVTGASCGFVAGAGRPCGVLQELSHQG